MQVPIKSITVKARVRQELGDLHGLMESLKKHGQLSPIVVTRRFDLIAGHRRLEAAKRLGWQAVDVVTVAEETEVEKLEMELDENVLRKDFSPSELLEGYRRLEKLRHPSVFRRMWDFIRGWFRKIFRRHRASGPAGPGDEPVAPGTSRSSEGPPSPSSVESTPVDADASDDEYRAGDYVV